MAVNHVELRVEGMSCQHCVDSIVKGLGNLNGVIGVTVDLEGKQVTVDFNEGMITLQAIKDEIEELGYEVV
ncbi:MAG TPA: copper ion binding protein [Bacillota bacterium]|nr:copper ion binding protein [Bacillota bacterium]HPT88084.1 copper ion binding protein [Bacillota bacterium]